MESKSTTYAKENIYVSVFASSGFFEIEAINLNSKKIYASKFETKNTDVTAVIDCIISGEAKIVADEAQIQISCRSLLNYTLYPTSHDETTLLKAEVAVLKALQAKTYRSEWRKVDSNTRHEEVFNHNMGAIPTSVTILFCPDKNDLDTVYDITWCQNYCKDHNPYNSALHSGSFLLTKTQIKIPIWEGGSVGRYWDASNWKVWKEGWIQVLLKADVF